MAVKLGSAFGRIRIDTRDVASASKKVVAQFKNMATKSRQFTKKLATGLKDTTKGFTDMKNAAQSVFAVLNQTVGVAIRDAEEHARVMGQTEAIIKATGSAAGLTANEVSKLANQFASLSGIDDEVIQEGENMLLTFKNIGGDVFPQATGALLDMSVALAQGDINQVRLKDTAIQLGKALNDPITGITALQRVGITLSASQKELIKDLVATGDTAGAQKVILAELQSEFGGAAEAAGETLTGKLGKARGAIESLTESIGEGLINVLGGAVDTFITLATASQQLSDAFVTHTSDMFDMLERGEVTAREFNDEIVRSGKVAGTISGMSALEKKIFEQGVTVLTTGERLIDYNGELLRVQRNVQLVDEAHVGTAIAVRNFDTGIEFTTVHLRDLAEMAGRVVEVTEEISESEGKVLHDLNRLKQLIDGPVGESQNKFIGQRDELRAQQQQIIEDLQRERDAHGDVSSFRIEATNTVQDLALAQSDLTIKQEKLAAAQLRLAEADPSASQTDLLHAVNQAAVAVENAKGKIGDYERGLGGTGTAISDTAEKQNELAQSLTDTNAALVANAQQHKEATQAMLFNMIQQEAAADGLTEAEKEALNELALQWDLIDQETHDTIDSMNDALSNLNATGDVDKFIEQLDNLDERLRSIPTEIVIDISTAGSGVPALPRGGSGNANSLPIVAHGGFATRIVPPGRDRTFIVRPGEEVRVRTPQQVAEGNGMGSSAKRITNVYLQNELAAQLWFDQDQRTIEIEASERMD